MDKELEDQLAIAREDALNEAYEAIQARIEHIQRLPLWQASGMRNQLSGLKVAAKIISDIDNEFLEDGPPLCHWCCTRHDGERKGEDGRYCPGPLLYDPYENDR